MVDEFTDGLRDPGDLNKLTDDLEADVIEILEPPSVGIWIANDG